MIAREFAIAETMLPHDKDAEQGVLGAILHNNDALLQVEDLLTAEAFFSPAHRELFKAMQSLTEQEYPIDEVTLGSYLKTRNRLEQIGGPLYILELLDVAPVTANVLVYAEIVREKFQLRQLIDAATEIAEKGRGSSEEVGKLIQEAEDIFLDLSSGATRRSFSFLNDILKENVFPSLEEMQAPGDGLRGLPSGFKDLDQYTFGFQRSDLIVLAARPSMGKTSFVLNVAKFAAIARDTPVLFFSLEMPKEQLAMRLLCMEASVDNQKLMSSSLDEFDWDKLATATGKLSEAKIIIDDSPNVTPLSLKAIARKVQAEHGLGMIIVDYLQFMSASKRTDNREQEVAEISRGLKATAKELNVPVIACAQLNRGLEQRPDKRPHLSDLRESGAIEQDADLVMFLYRDEVYHPETEDQGIAEIHIAKHRNGPITSRPIRLAFIPQYTKFANLALREDENSYN